MISANVIFLPYMRVIKIPNAVVLIEANQKSAVSHRDVSWHGLFLAKSFNGGKEKYQYGFILTRGKG
jgi:hypothetical protein